MISNWTSQPHELVGDLAGSDHVAERGLLFDIIERLGRVSKATNWFGYGADGG